MQLDPDQQTRLDAYAEFARTLSDCDLVDQLIRLYRQIMLYDKHYQQRVREAWGIDFPFPAASSNSPQHTTDDRDSWLAETT